MAFAGLTGKVAVVTGAGSGIGAGVAGRLSEEEAHVVVVDRDENRATTVAGELGGDALAVAADVSEEGGVRAYMDAAVERFGRIDVYHLHAGIAGTPVPIPEIEYSEWIRSSAAARFPPFQTSAMKRRTTALLDSVDTGRSLRLDRDEMTDDYSSICCSPRRGALPPPGPVKIPSFSGLTRLMRRAGANDCE